MRIFLLLLTLLTSPVFALDYCSCYQVDIEDPYMRPVALREWLDAQPDTGSAEAYPYDCYWVAGGNQGDPKLCIPGCQAAGQSYVDLTRFDPTWQQLIASGVCKVPDKTSQGDTSTPCATTDCSQNNGNGDGSSGNGSTTQTNINLPCGYPGAKYTDCNVYDAKVHTETKNIVTEAKNVVAAVKDVHAAANALLVHTTSSSISLSQLFTESKGQTTKLQEITDAVTHKNLKLTIGSCVEAEKLVDKLPKLEGDLLGDKLLTGFSCSGDLILCNQIKLQAQSYCRDVISQRLQAMYLNGGNVFIKCQEGYTGQLDASSKPVCHFKTGECLAAGQSQPMGKNLPPCNLPVEVKCPSEEFVPVIIEGGFSCDTKLAAGKTNQQSIQLQKIIDALNPDSRTTTFVDKAKPVVDKVLANTEKDVKLSEIVTSPKPDLTSLNVPTVSTSKSVAELIGDNQFRMSIFGYEIWNPFDFLQIFTSVIITPFASDIVLFLFAPVSGCQLDFSSIQRSIVTLIGGQGEFIYFDNFRDELCETYIPFIRALLSMFLSWQLTVHVYFEVFNIMSIVTSMGSSTANSYGRLNSTASSRGYSSNIAE